MEDQITLGYKHIVLSFKPVVPNRCTAESVSNLNFFWSLSSPKVPPNTDLPQTGFSETIKVEDHCFKSLLPKNWSISIKSSRLIENRWNTIPRPFVERKTKKNSTFQSIPISIMVFLYHIISIHSLL